MLDDLINNWNITINKPSYPVAQAQKKEPLGCSGSSQGGNAQGEGVWLKWSDKAVWSIVEWTKTIQINEVLHLAALFM